MATVNKAGAERRRKSESDMRNANGVSSILTTLADANITSIKNI
jgi:hypothetical protein